jgi:hypothetical protein
VNSDRLKESEQRLITRHTSHITKKDGKAEECSDPRVRRPN